MTRVDAARIRVKPTDSTFEQVVFVNTIQNLVQFGDAGTVIEFRDTRPELSVEGTLAQIDKRITDAVTEWS